MINTDDDGIDDDAEIKIQPFIHIQENGKLRFYYKLFDIEYLTGECGSGLDSLEGIWFCSNEDGTYTLNGNDLTIVFEEKTEYDTIEYDGKDNMRVNHPDGWTDLVRASISDIEGAGENCELFDDDD